MISSYMRCADKTVHKAAARMRVTGEQANQDLAEGLILPNSAD